MKFNNHKVPRIRSVNRRCCSAFPFSGANFKLKRGFYDEKWKENSNKSAGGFIGSGRIGSNRLRQWEQIKFGYVDNHQRFVRPNP